MRIKYLLFCSFLTLMLSCAHMHQPNTNGQSFVHPGENAVNPGAPAVPAEDAAPGLGDGAPEGGEQADSAASEEAFTVPAEGALTPGIPAGQEPVVPAEIFQLPAALEQVKMYFKAPVYPVLKNGSLFILTYDLDGDGWFEIFVPAIESEHAEYADLAYLSHFSRLYDLEDTGLAYRLYIFTYRDNRYTLQDQVDCGFNQVFKSFTFFYGNSGLQNPLILSLTFQTQEGMLQKWVIFSKPQLKAVSTLEIMENLLKKAIIEDIDKDGLLDVVLLESSAEDKLGYETYLTWLKWNGKSFREYKNTNIVRNLNNFMREVKGLLIGGEPDKLLTYAVEKKFLDAARSRGLNVDQILARFLGLINVGGEQAAESLLAGISGVIFPEILDNPFSQKDAYGYYFHLSYRINYEDDISVIARTKLYMSANPFNSRQFTFRSSLE